MFTKVSWARRLYISNLQLKMMLRREDLNLLANLALQGSLLRRHRPAERSLSQTDEVASLMAIRTDESSGRSTPENINVFNDMQERRKRRTGCINDSLYLRLIYTYCPIFQANLVLLQIWRFFQQPLTYTFVRFKASVSMILRSANCSNVEPVAPSRQTSKEKRLCILCLLSDFSLWNRLSAGSLSFRGIVMPVREAGGASHLHGVRSLSGRLGL